MSRLLADGENIPTVEEQYSSASYADYVEDESNSDFYRLFIHPSLIEALSPHLASASSALDVGCGNGVLGRVIRDANPRVAVTGVDRSRAMLERARAAENLRANGDDGNGTGEEVEGTLPTTTTTATATTQFIRADFLKKDEGTSELAERTFDIVVSGFVLCHLPSRADVRWFFRRTYGLMGPGSVTAHIVPPGDGLKNGATEGSVYRAVISNSVVVYDYLWSKETYMDAMAEAGFAGVRVEECRVHGGGADKSTWETQMNSEGWYILVGFRDDT